jgi:hypothetical protein
MARDAVNFVMTYTVSDTETLRKVHLFVWPEPYDPSRETRSDAFSPQDLPPDQARARLTEFRQAALRQSRSPNPAARAAAADAAARLEALMEN